MAIDNAEPAASSEATPELAHCTVRVDGVQAIVAVAGEIDMSSADSVREMCLAALRHDDVVTLRIDLGGVTFCDASGINVLVYLADRMHARGGRVRLENVPSTVQRLLDVLALTELQT